MFNKNILIRFLLAAVLGLQSATFSVAEEKTDFPELQRKSIPGEAAEAVFGRVFGTDETEANIDYHVWDFSAPTPGNAGFRSFLVPGWGQAFNEQPKKGFLLFTAALATGVGSAVLYHESNKTFDEYQDKGVQNDSLYDDYERERLQSVVLGSMAGILWVYGIYDAMKNGYPHNRAENRKIDLVVGNEGGSVFWTQKF